MCGAGYALGHSVFDIPAPIGAPGATSDGAAVHGDNNVVARPMITVLTWLVGGVT